MSNVVNNIPSANSLTCNEELGNIITLSEVCDLINRIDDVNSLWFNVLPPIRIAWKFDELIFFNMFNI